ncbi:MAG: 2-oxoacid:acceptor oxidoreductase subunit alpha [Candidatus Thermoplasmatota archaeon]|nr:2-oxoacid:acceptor oxidoreductase subunit alpha [Candidatus Thermoplasmatota archaeon]
MLDSRPVLTGEHFVKGDVAVMEGAIAAGCRFYAGYPITPSSEIAERASQRLPLVGGEYIQMEDEIGSLAAVIGASCVGAKAMTATSGPGLSLMMEHIGLASMLETPCVIVDVQRGGPSTGLPTLTSQGDMMQARWGSHGDYEIVAYAPSTVQEMFDFAIKAFNAAETYRIPVLVMADQIIAQMTTKLVIPPEEEIETVYRPIPDVPAEEYLPFDSSYLVPPMALAGTGYRLHMTGLTHSDAGYPETNVPGQEALVPRLVRKIRENEEKIVEVEERLVDDAEVGLVIYGSTAGPGWEAVQAARKEGIKAGMLRLVTPWPFPREPVRRLSEQVDAILVAEVNMGQMVHPVMEHAECPVHHLGLPGGRIFHPDEILRGLRKVVT